MPKFRCVKVSGHPETKKLMDEAFKCLTDEKANPEEFSEDECLEVTKKEKTIIYMFDVFEGKAFEHIVGLGYRVYGPMCILTCVSCNKDIPKGGKSVYNLAMKDVVVTCTNVETDMRQSLYEKVVWMGGQYSKDLQEDATHVIAGAVGRMKYRIAAERGLPIMLPSWVEDVWNKSKLEAVFCKDEQFQVHKCPIFLGCHVVVSGLHTHERNEIERLVKKEGGQYEGELRVRECTHLIINQPKGQKYMFALKWNICIVRSEWLYDSIEKGYCLDEEDYKLCSTSEENKGQMKTSTPERKSLAASGMGDISNISMISMVTVNETKFNSTTMSTNLTQLADLDPVEQLDMKKPVTEMFLDGCKIFLSGFRGAVLEKLRKVINVGGGTRFNQITDNLTHVVIGERIDKDIDQIKALLIRPHVVTSQWICDCFNQEMCLDTFNYASKEIPLDPTTPKKKGPKKSIKPTANDKVKPSTSKQDIPSKPGDDPAEDMNDILSQYMAQPEDQDETRKSNDTTLGPADNVGAPVTKGVDMMEDDMTQDPDATTNVTDGSAGIFHKKVFVILGFNDEIVVETSGVIAEHGGTVLEQNSRKIPDFAIVPLYGYPVDRTVGDVVTNIWLDMCLEQNSFLDCRSNPLFSPVEIHEDASPLKDCVLSVSGYAGTEREALMHIAEVLGAVNQECFLRVPKNGLLASTQLIVNAPSGSKYKAAKKWGIPAVSKNWLLVCAESGKLESVENYLIDNERDNQPTEQLNIQKDSSKETESVAKQDKPAISAIGGDKPQVNTPKSRSRSVASVSKSDLNQSAVGVKDDNTKPTINQMDENYPGANQLDGNNSISSQMDGNNAIANQVDRNNLNINKQYGADFSATGDTEALLLAMNSQNRPDLTSNDLNIDKQNICAAGASNVNNVPQSVQSSAQTKPQCVKNCAQSVDKRSDDMTEVGQMETIEDEEIVLQYKESKDNEDQRMASVDDGPSSTKVMSARQRLMAMPSGIRNWQDEVRRMKAKREEESKSQSSQKENMDGVSTPLQSRVRALQNEGAGSLRDEDTPSKFLNPNVTYIPKFDTTELLKAFETPEAERAAKAKKRRSSLPLDELFAQKLDQALENQKKAREKRMLDSQKYDDEVDGDNEMDIGVLQGVIISVAKKLAKDQSDLNELVTSLGGDYRWNLDKSCTHFIFQGRQNDTARDFKLARNNGCTIVHPHWLFMCKEQNLRVDEAMYPHTFNPNLALSVVSSKRTPLKTPGRTPARSTRSTRDRLGSKPDKNPPPLILEPELTKGDKPVTPKGDNNVFGADRKESTPKGENHIKSPGSARRNTPTVVNLRKNKESPHNLNKSSSEDDTKEHPDLIAEAAATGGSLEMREMLSRQLENVMAESKGKKRRRSKRLNCSGGQVATPEDPSSAKQANRTQEGVTRNSGRTSKSLSEPDKPVEEKASQDLAPSQSVQVLWDDPMGRMEQEKLAHKLERACSPTQDMNGFYDADPADAQYSESEGESEIPVPPFENQQEERTTPKADKPTSDKTPTPEGPSIAFPTNSKVDRITPPKPVVLTEPEEFPSKSLPVFMLSGMNQAEKDDYGALIEKLGGKLIDCQQFDPSCTHLIISNISRNEKLLGSIAAGKWVLHKSYFEECRQENKFVQEDLYEWGSGGTLSLLKNLDNNVRLLAIAARDWRIRVQEQQKKSKDVFGAYCGWRVVLCCDKNREGNYKRLLEAGGATVLNLKPPFTKKVDATHVLMELHKVTLSQDDLEMLINSGCLCLRPEFISAHLSDSKADIQNYTPPEIKALQTVLSDSSDTSRKKRKASSGEVSVKRSKRRQ